MSAPCPTCAPLVEHLQGQVRRWYGQLRAEQLAAWERDEWGAEHPGIPEEPPDLEAGPKGLSIHFGDEPSRSGLLAETERLRGRVRELEAQLLLARSTAEAAGVDAARQYRFIADGHYYIVRADGSGTPIFAIEHLGSERVTKRALVSGRVLITGSDGRPLLLVAACEDVEDVP